VLATLSQLQTDKKKLLEELDRHKDCDPEVMEQMKEDAVVAREAANRWTGIELDAIAGTLQSRRVLGTLLWMHA